MATVIGGRHEKKARRMYEDILRARVQGEQIRPALVERCHYSRTTYLGTINYTSHVKRFEANSMVTLDDFPVSSSLLAFKYIDSIDSFPSPAIQSSNSSSSQNSTPTTNTICPVTKFLYLVGPSALSRIFLDGASCSLACSWRLIQDCARECFRPRTQYSVDRCAVK